MLIVKIFVLVTNSTDVETRDIIVGIATDIDLIHYISRSELRENVNFFQLFLQKSIEIFEGLFSLYG